LGFPVVKANVETDEKIALASGVAIVLIILLVAFLSRGGVRNPTTATA
jgi:hypothetical protein